MPRKRNFGGSYFQILHSGGDHKSEKVRNMIAVNLVSFLGERNVYLNGLIWILNVLSWNTRLASSVRTGKPERTKELSQQMRRRHDS
jgi:hypothetical protein